MIVAARSLGKVTSSALANSEDHLLPSFQIPDPIGEGLSGCMDFRQPTLLGVGVVDGRFGFVRRVGDAHRSPHTLAETTEVRGRARYTGDGGNLTDIQRTADSGSKAGSSRRRRRRLRVVAARRGRKVRRRRREVAGHKLSTVLIAAIFARRAAFRVSPSRATTVLKTTDALPGRTFVDGLALGA